MSQPNWARVAVAASAVTVLGLVATKYVNQRKAKVAVPVPVAEVKAQAPTQVAEPVAKTVTPSPIAASTAPFVTTLKGRAAIVTGSTSGIGLGIARSLAAQGVNIVLSGSRDRAPGDAVDQLRAEFRDVKIVYCQAPLDKLPKSAEDLINTAIKEFGRLDILVNNAGIQHVAPLEQFPTSEWDRLVAINLSSAFHTMRLAMPEMRKNATSWGRIINISSVHGKVASVNKAAYVATKHALNGLTKVAALECAADSNITVNAVCPGWVHTPLVQAQIMVNAQRDGITEDQARCDLLSKKQPRPKFAQTADIGAYIVFLCSEHASNITGAEQVIDGAWTVQ